LCLMASTMRFVSFGMWLRGKSTKEVRGYRGTRAEPSPAGVVHLACFQDAAVAIRGDCTQKTHWPFVCR
jgi:hypothetical protein